MSRILLTAVGSMAANPAARRYQALGHTVFGCDIYPREWTPLAGEIDFFQARLATEGEPYVEQLKEAVRRDGLDFLIPLTDPEVDALSPRKAEFRALGCTVCVPEEPVAALCRRKDRMNRFLAEKQVCHSQSKNSELAVGARKQRCAGLREMCCGTGFRGSVPQPQSSSLALPCQTLVSVDGCQSLAAFGSCIHRMHAPSRRPITPAGGSASCTSPFFDAPRQVCRLIPTESAVPGQPCPFPFPVMVKPRSGRSSMGQAVAADEKNYQTALAGREDCIVQPFLEGAVFCVDVARDNAGHIRAAARQELLRNKSGLGMTVEVLPGHPLEAVCAAIAEAIGLVGVVNMEFIRHGDEFFFLEVNPRFSGGLGFSMAAGMDFAEMMLLCHSGGSVEAFPAAPKHALLARESQIILTKQL